MKKYFVIILFFFLYSSNYNKKTTFLNSYLKENNIIEFIENEKPILVVNTRGCGSCIKKNLKTTTELLSSFDFNLILLGSKYIDSYNFKNAYIDSTSSFSKLNISPYYDCLIKTDNGEIIEIIELDFEFKYEDISTQF